MLLHPSGGLCLHWVQWVLRLRLKRKCYNCLMKNTVEDTSGAEHERDDVSLLDIVKKLLAEGPEISRKLLEEGEPFFRKAFDDPRHEIVVDLETLRSFVQVLPDARVLIVKLGIKTKSSEEYRIVTQMNDYPWIKFNFKKTNGGWRNTEISIGKPRMGAVDVKDVLRSFVSRGETISWIAETEVPSADYIRGLSLVPQ